MIEVVEGYGADITAIMPVMDSSFDPMFSEAWSASQCLSTLSLPGSHLLLARSQDRIVGFALTRGVVGEEELLLIGVSPQAQRQGVGRLLIENLICLAQQSSRELIFLEVREGNPAQLFYQKMGFGAIGRRPGYYKSKNGTRYDSITMSLKL